MQTHDTESETAEKLGFDVRLLGVVTVVGSDGAPLNLGGPKPKTVFVRLALEPGEIVTTDALVDLLWGDEPPRTARRSVQAHVAKLRAALATAGVDLSSRGPGYVLNVPRSRVDAHRMEDGLRLARELMPTDPAGAEAHLTACSSEWTGTPFADLPGELGLLPHREHLLRLRDALEDAQHELRLVAGDPTRLIVDLERAVANDPTHEPHWVRLITAYYAGGRQRDALDAYARARTVMIEELGIDPSPRLRRLEAQILNQDEELATAPAECPYKGLLSYQVSDGADFHGRADTIDELVELVIRAPLGVVVGPSGVGKSSVLRAGLAYRALTGRVPGVKSVRVITPGNRPLQALYEIQQPVDLLIVDQFEELFTLSSDPTRSAEFVDELTNLAASGRTRVIVSVRADFYGHCLDMAQLADALRRHQVNIGPMSEVGLRESIVGPAANAGLEVEPKLVQAAVAEVTDRPGALPLLSHALAEAWRRRSSEVLTLGAYRDAGSIAGAIAATAERLYSSLDAAGQDQLRRLCRRLVEPGTGTVHTRNVVGLADLPEAGIDGALVERMVDARLLTAGVDTIEIAHEALIAAWPRLHEWIDSERDDIATHQRLTRAASAWVESDRDEADLHRGNKLAATATWIEESTPRLTVVEQEFLDASRDMERRLHEQEARANLRLRRVTAMSVAAMVLALIAGGVAFLQGRDATSRADELEANQLADVIAADDNLSLTDRLHAAAALHARNTTPATSELLLGALLEAPSVVQSDDLPMDGFISSTNLLRAGFLMLVEGEDGQPAMVDTYTFEVDTLGLDFVPVAIDNLGGEVHALHPETFEIIDVKTNTPVGPRPSVAGVPSTAAFFAVDEAELLVLGHDATGDTGAFVDVFTVADGNHFTRIEWDEGEFDSVTGLDVLSESDNFEAVTDRAFVLVELDDLVIELWDVANNERLVGTAREVTEAAVGGVVSRSASQITAFSLHRSDVFTLGRADGTVELWRWQPNSGWSQVTAEHHHDAPVTWIEMSLGDDFIASSADDGTVVVIDGDDGRVLINPIELETTGDVRSYFIDVDPIELATVDSAGKMWKWTLDPADDLTTPLPIAVTGRPIPGEDALYGVADERAVVWSASEVRDLGHDPEVLGVTTGRSGEYAVVYAERVDWHESDGELIRSIEARGWEIEDRVAVAAGRVALAVPGQVIVVDREDGIVREVDTLAIGGAQSIDLSDSGEDLVVSTSFGAVTWFDVDGVDDRQMLADGVGHDAQFVPDGRVVAVGGDGIVLVQLDGGREDLAVGRGEFQVALDLERAIAATTDANGTITLWDTEGGEELATATITVDDDRPTAIGFGPDGLLIVSTDSSTVAMNTLAEDWRALACAFLHQTKPSNDLPRRVESFAEPC